MKEMHEIRQYSEQDLLEEKKRAQEELQQTRFNAVLGFVENPLKKRTLRRRVARINTYLHELRSARV